MVGVHCRPPARAVHRKKPHVDRPLVLTGDSNQYILEGQNTAHARRFLVLTSSGLPSVFQFLPFSPHSPSLYIIRGWEDLAIALSSTSASRVNDTNSQHHNTTAPVGCCRGSLHRKHCLHISRILLLNFCFSVPLT